MAYSYPYGNYSPLYAQMLKTGHHLIAGATGSGKSVVLNGILYTFLHQYSPTDGSLIVIDPKRVELHPYAALPHTLAYAETAQEALSVLSAVAAVTDERYIDMQARRLKTYDGAPVYIIIDEIADLLTANGLTSKLIDQQMTHLLRLGRAAKVFLFMATQDPSRRTIKAQIQQNCPNCIALRCRTAIESKQIIGVAGAETLPAYGTMLYKTADGITKYTGVPLISDGDLFDRIEFWNRQG